MNKEAIVNQDNQFKQMIRAAIIGLLTGLVVSTFRLIIQHFLKFVSASFAYFHHHPTGLIYWAIGSVILALILGQLAQRYPNIKGSGIPQVEGQLKCQFEEKWWPVLWRKYLGGIFAIGSGLFGQGVAETAHVNSLNRRVGIASGAAAGLAAAFNAPIASTIFILEEVYHNFSPLIWLATFISSLCSNMVSMTIFGLKPVLNVPYQYELPVGLYWHLIILGVLLGLLGHLYKVGLFSLKKVYAKITFLPRWLHGLIPLALLIPIAYFWPLITGPGNRLILSLPNMITKTGWGLVGLLAFYYVMRIVFSIVAYDSGLPSGIFLPILTMGALIGATYGMFMVQLGLLPQRLVVNLVIFSMAGYFAAIIRAPFTAIILITEMVGSLLHLMPLAVVAFIALLVDELLGGKPIYGLLAAAMDTSSDSKANYTGEADQMVLPVYESSKLVDKKVADIKWPEDTRVRTIRRDGDEIIPTGQTIVRGGDMLILEFDSSQRGRVYSSMKKLQGVELDG